MPAPTIAARLPRTGGLLPVLAAASFALSGCGAVAMSDARLQAATEAEIGQPVTAVYNRRSDGMSNTYYEARTPKGRYSCVANGTVALAGIACKRT